MVRFSRNIRERYYNICAVHALFTIHWYGCRGCREKFKSSIEYDSFFVILLILVSQRFTVIRKMGQKYMIFEYAQS